MLISLSEIMSVPNQTKRMEIPVEMADFLMDGVKYEFVSKPPFELAVTNLGERRVKLEGGMKIVLNIPCSRCLEDVQVDFDIEIDEEVDFKQLEEDPDQLDEKTYITGYNLDVERLIYNEMLIGFPLQTLCKEDCRGICKVCGVNLNRETCSCDQTVQDPRMAAFQNIFDQFKEV